MDEGKRQQVPSRRLLPYREMPMQRWMAPLALLVSTCVAATALAVQRASCRNTVQQQLTLLIEADGRQLPAHQKRLSDANRSCTLRGKVHYGPSAELDRLGVAIVANDLQMAKDAFDKGRSANDAFTPGGLDAGQTPVQYAAMYGDARLVREIGQQVDFDRSDDEGGANAYFYAVGNALHQCAVMAELRRMGFDPSHRNRQGFRFDQLIDDHGVPLAKDCGTTGANQEHIGPRAAAEI